MDLPRELTNRLFQLAQNPGQKSLFGVIGAAGGVPSACIPLDVTNPEDVASLMARFQEEGLKPFATFALNEDLSGPPDRPNDLGLPSLPHLMIGTRIKGVLEMDAYVDGPSGWTSIELRLPDV